jgi:hypothetical protein
MNKQIVSHFPATPYDLFVIRNAVWQGDDIPSLAIAKMRDFGYTNCLITLSKTANSTCQHAFRQRDSEIESPDGISLFSCEQKP